LTVWSNYWLKTLKCDFTTRNAGKWTSSMEILDVVVCKLKECGRWIVITWKSFSRKRT
jgi:hypothetical protein